MVAECVVTDLTDPRKLNSKPIAGKARSTLFLYCRIGKGSRLQNSRNSGCGIQMSLKQNLLTVYLGSVRGKIGGGREAQEEGDICIFIADSCCTAETNTPL